jgi:hypothetical protein
MKISASLALFLCRPTRQVFSSAPVAKVEALPQSLKSPGRLTEERDLLLGAAALQAQGGDGQTADVAGHGPDLDLSPGQEIGAAGTQLFDQEVHQGIQIFVSSREHHDRSSRTRRRSRSRSRSPYYRHR